MSNFIGMVFATLKKEGIDTSKMDTSEAIAKYNEIQGGGNGSSAKGEETPKTEKKTAETGKQTAERGTIEKDSADATVSKKETVEEEPKKVDASELYDESRKDKYGNPMLSKKYHDIAKQAGQEYIDSMTKYYSMDKLIQSNVFPGYLCNKICDGLNEATNDIPDITTTEIEEIVSELTGYNFNYDEYETGRGGYTTYFSKKQSAPGTAEKMSTAMGVSPDEAKAFVSGKGSLTKGGIEDKTDYASMKPTTYSNLQDDIWNKNYITEQMNTKKGDEQWQFIEDVMTMRHNQYEEFRKKNKNVSYEDFVKSINNLR